MQSNGFFKIVLCHFQQYLSYIMVTSCSGGRNRREPPTMDKQLVNFITCGCESSAPFKKNDLEKDQLFVHILHSSSTAEGPGGSKS
jgi:hypothetical protein